MVGNKVAYIIFLLLTGMFAVLYNSYFTGILFLAIVLIPVVLYVILFITSSKITVNLLSGRNMVTKGEAEEIVLEFTNKSLFPLNRVLIPIEYVNEVTGIKRNKIVELALEQKSTQKVCINLQSSHCGNINITIKKILIFDFLHIWKKRKNLSLNTVIAVVPDIYETDTGLINKVYTINSSSDSERYSKEKKGDDVSEVFDVRDYKPGDKPNRIHRKLSQRLDQVMIKEFSEPLKDSVAFILYPFCNNNGEIRLNLLDGFLEGIITLSNSCLREGKSLTMIWYDTVLEQYNEYLLNKGEDKYYALLSMLKSPVLTEYVPVMKEFQQLQNMEYTGLFFITTDLQEDNLEYLLYQSKITSCSLIFVNDLDQVSLSLEIKKELYKYQIPHYEIDIKNVKKAFQNIVEGNLNVQSRR
ncbi:MAG: hypothetical protein K0S61_3441 [Anaerocolumna sp.]|jgi:hypothetical protein|nr:hypothetical protein [Anaerocolumna sp.]